MLRGHHVATPDEFNLFLQACALCVFPAFLVWVVYLAFEP
jgi:hypothetical protein